MIKKVFVRSASFLLVLLFLYAAISKLVDYGEFRTSLADAPHIGQYAAVLSWFIPALEIYISLMLLFSATRLTGLYASFVLMTAFTVYIGYLLATGSDLPCECGGILNEMSWETHLMFNCFFVALSGAAAIAERRRLKRTPQPA